MFCNNCGYDRLSNEYDQYNDDTGEFVKVCDVCNQRIKEKRLEVCTASLKSQLQSHLLTEK
jgi:hypothetical protein